MNIQSFIHVLDNFKIRPEYYYHYDVRSISPDGKDVEQLETASWAHGSELSMIQDLTTHYQGDDTIVVDVMVIHNETKLGVDLYTHLSENDHE